MCHCLIQIIKQFVYFSSTQFLTVKLWAPTANSLQIPADLSEVFSLEGASKNRETLGSVFVVFFMPQFNKLNQRYQVLFE